jgi:hypothetical protein
VSSFDIALTSFLSLRERTKVRANLCIEERMNVRGRGVHV